MSFKVCFLCIDLSTCICPSFTRVTQHGDTVTGLMLSCRFKKNIRKQIRLLLCRWKTNNMLKTPQRQSARGRQTPEVNVLPQPSSGRLKTANRCLVANTQHISHNQRGLETVVLLQQKHQRNAQQLMLQNARCGIHYISIQRCCSSMQLSANRGSFHTVHVCTVKTYLTLLITFQTWCGIYICLLYINYIIIQLLQCYYSVLLICLTLAGFSSWLDNVIKLWPISILTSERVSQK